MSAWVRDNTLFIFSSDNGGPAPGKITDNGKYRGGKGGLYEGGVRVAATVAWDGHIKASSTIKERGGGERANTARRSWHELQSVISATD